MSRLQEGKSNALAAYTVTLLKHEARYLLLQRSRAKRLMPGRWTGIGGRVENDELHDLRASALRELWEESEVAEEEIGNFTLRRALLHNRPGEPITLLLYFTATLPTGVLPSSTEGTLSWVTQEEMERLDIIETTDKVLPYLFEDMVRDPSGEEPVYLGLACYSRDGELQRVVWG